MPPKITPWKGPPRELFLLQPLTSPAEATPDEAAIPHDPLAPSADTPPSPTPHPPEPGAHTLERATEN